MLFVVVARRTKASKQASKQATNEGRTSQLLLPKISPSMGDLCTGLQSSAPAWGLEHAQGPPHT